MIVLIFQGFDIILVIVLMGGAICGANDTLFVEYFQTDFSWKKHLTNYDYQELHSILTNEFPKENKSCKQIIAIISKQSQTKKQGLYYSRHKFVYFGQIKENKPHGSGVAVFYDRFSYVGEFKSGILQGKGKLYSPTDQIVQDGEWKNGKFVKGKYVGFSRTSKVKYVQIYDENDFKVKYDDQSKYDGQGKFINGKFIIEGKGKFSNAQKTYSYQGMWKNNQKHGNGFQVIINGHNTERYNGNFQNNERKGEGTLTMADGSYLRGTWMNDKQFQCRFFDSHSRQLGLYNERGKIRSLVQDN